MSVLNQSTIKSLFNKFQTLHTKNILIASEINGGVLKYNNNVENLTHIE